MGDGPVQFSILINILVITKLSPHIFKKIIFIRQGTGAAPPDGTLLWGVKDFLNVPDGIPFLCKKGKIICKGGEGFLSPGILVEGAAAAETADLDVIEHGSQDSLLADQNIPQAIQPFQMAGSLHMADLRQGRKGISGVLEGLLHLFGVPKGSGTAAHAFLGGINQFCDVFRKRTQSLICQKEDFFNLRPDSFRKLSWDRKGTGSLCGNVLGSTECACLPGIEGSAAGTIDTVGAAGFSDTKQSLDPGLPPMVDTEPSVAMLDTESDF